MTTRNSSRFLREQLDSVLVQTLPPIEIVISDDGSTDDTLDILAEYAMRDRRIAIVRNELVGGDRINRNFENAARRCTGNWVAFCDHDDIWLPHKLELLCSNGRDFPLVYGRSELVDEDARPMGVTAEDYLGFPGFFSGAVPLYALMDTNTVSGHAMIVRRTVIKDGLPFLDRVHYDHWVALVALCTGGGIRFVDEPVVLHRIHTGNSVHYVRPRGRRRCIRRTVRERYRDRIERRVEVLHRLQAFEQGLDSADRAFLWEYLDHLGRAPMCFFDLRFFLAGFAMRKRLYPQKAAWHLFNECFGGRCYGV